MDLDFNTDLDTEVSWFFNDINLTMVMLILFYAIIFATMVSQGGAQTAKNDISQDYRMPTDLSSLNYFGETGFPQASQEKGFPVKKTFNTDLILSENTSDKEGMHGNRVWEFEELSAVKNKKTLEIIVSKTGDLVFEGENYEMEEMRKFIDAQAETFHVFLKIIIDPSASVFVYEKLRDDLWNQTNATHWEFFTEK